MNPIISITVSHLLAVVWFMISMPICHLYWMVKTDMEEKSENSLTVFQESRCYLWHDFRPHHCLPDCRLLLWGHINWQAGTKGGKKKKKALFWILVHFLLCWHWLSNERTDTVKHCRKWALVNNSLFCIEKGVTAEDEVEEKQRGRDTESWR